MNKITNATKKNPIEAEITIKQGEKINIKKFKIYGIIDAYNRTNELKAAPRTPRGNNDNWLISKMICEKDGGRLPTVSELAIIAALQEERLIDTNYYGLFWSASESSSTTAVGRVIDSKGSSWYQGYRYGEDKPLCLGDCFNG